MIPLGALLGLGIFLALVIAVQWHQQQAALRQRDPRLDEKGQAFDWPARLYDWESGPTRSRRNDA